MGYILEQLELFQNMNCKNKQPTNYDIKAV